MKWAEQAMRLLMAARGRPSLEYPFHLHPLRVLKQIVCMFFSVNNPGFQQAHPDLVRFVLNREVRQFPPEMKIYVFYTLSMRSSGATSAIQGFGSGNSTLHAFSESTFTGEAQQARGVEPNKMIIAIAVVGGLLPAEPNSVARRRCSNLRLRHGKHRALNA